MKTAMNDASTDPVVELDQRWRERRVVWARKLGRLHLGVEPLDAQLERHRRLTWGLSAVTGTISAMFVALFAAFGRPDVGLILVAILPAPLVALAWADYLRLVRRADAYGREYDAYLAERARLVESQTDAAPRST
jgi:hypothetical protein